MIVGVGTDIVSMDRISAALSRFGDRFRNRIYAESELAFADRFPDGTGALAKRWAAKEACSKALGTGLRQGVAMRNMVVVSSPSGMPTVRLDGKARERLRRIVPDGQEGRIHLSMTDDAPWAAAIVVIEARRADLLDSHAAPNE